jgi:DNA-dependent RNA polymerase
MKPLKQQQIEKEQGLVRSSRNPKAVLKNKIQGKYLLQIVPKIEAAKGLHPMLQSHPIETGCVALQEVIAGALKEKSVQAIALDVTKALEDCWEMIKLKGTGELRLLETKHSKRKGRSGRTALEESYLRYSEGQPILDLRQKVQVGAAVLDLILKEMPCLFLYQAPRTQLWHVAVTNEILELQQELEQSKELFGAGKEPMLCPPLNWVSGQKRGGYLTTRMQYPVKSRGSLELPQPWVQSINKLQEIEWTVSGEFYRFLLKETKHLTGPEQLLLGEAGKYLDKKCWFPYQVDGTGRYIGQSKMHPQRGKLAKSLMGFYKSQVVSKAGREAQLDALAKAWGCARDYLPAETKMWQNWETESKDKWETIRLLWELKQARTSWPISVDGTCNAVQHYAALLRDSDTGALVGMVNDLNRNLYSVISAKTGLTRDYVKSIVVPYLFSKELGTSIFERMVDTGESYKQSSEVVKSLLLELERLAPATLIGKRELTLVFGRAQQFKTPLGFAPFLDYTKQEKIRVPISVGKYTRVTLNKDSSTPDLAKRRKAAAPNIIASLAAEHATRTILQFPGPIRYIYDDFGVLPNQVQEIKHVLGETLFQQYQCFNRPGAVWDLQSVRGRRYMFR